MVESAKILTFVCLWTKFGSADGEITYRHLLTNLLCNPALPECHLGSCQLCGTAEDNLLHCSHCTEENATSAKKYNI